MRILKEIECELDLDTIEGRRGLIDRTKAIPGIGELVDEALPGYLELFKWSVFRRIQRGGVIFYGAGSREAGIDLERMLQTTRRLNALRPYAGHSELMAGFGNPTQIESTLFEVNMAYWCHCRKITKGLEFSPVVECRGKMKRPDFRWNTSIGSVVAECKLENVIENSIQRRSSRLFEKVRGIYEKYDGWSAHQRIDIEIGHSARDSVDGAIASLISQAFFRSRHEETFELSDGLVRVIVRPRVTPSPGERHTIRHAVATIGQTPTKMCSENSPLTLTMSTLAHRLRLLPKLLRDARSQLPENEIGAIFLGMPYAPELSQRLETLLVTPAAVSLACAFLCDQETPNSLVHVNGQPFDTRCLDG